MNVLNRSTVVGVFADAARARQAVTELRRRGVGDDAIGVAAREGEVTPFAPHGSHWGAGAATGAAAGGATGTLLGVAVAAGLIPGVGPVVAGGLLAGLLASAAAGGTAGGVIGALIGLGVPEAEAAYYHDESTAGRVLLTVRAGDRAGEVANVLRSYGAYDVESR